MNEPVCRRCGREMDSNLHSCEYAALVAENAALRAALAEANEKLEAAARMARESQLVAEAFTRQMEGK